ncbi:MAG: hypothetical protein ACYDHX_09745 [Methanothrix sp.]
MNKALTEPVPSWAVHLLRGLPALENIGICMVYAFGGTIRQGKSALERDADEDRGDRSEGVVDQYEIIMGQNFLWTKLKHIQRLAWLNY